MAKFRVKWALCGCALIDHLFDFHKRCLCYRFAKIAKIAVHFFFGDRALSVNSGYLWILSVVNEGT